MEGDVRKEAGAGGGCAAAVLLPPFVVLLPAGAGPWVASRAGGVLRKIYVIARSHVGVPREIVGIGVNAATRAPEARFGGKTELCIRALRGGAGPGHTPFMVHDRVVVSGRGGNRPLA